MCKICLQELQLTWLVIKGQIMFSHNVRLSTLVYWELTMFSVYYIGIKRVWFLCNWKWV